MLCPVALMWSAMAEVQLYCYFNEGLKVFGFSYREAVV